ncbi:hypothetical protein FRB94_005850 [Tulasnella sp. JGI-2019a]|nr:hypothetical protein FRB94_005850 [Tulasnella sp. JGI-2019a]
MGNRCSRQTKQLRPCPAPWAGAIDAIFYLSLGAMNNTSTMAVISTRQSQVRALKVIWLPRAEGTPPASTLFIPREKPTELLAAISAIEVSNITAAAPRAFHAVLTSG